MIEKSIRRFREEKGWSQNDLSNKTGITQPLIARWESGHAVPSKKSLVKLAKAFGISLERFNSVPQLDEKEVRSLSSKIAKLDISRQSMIDSLVNTLLFPNGFDNESMYHLERKLQRLSPADQIYVQGLIRRVGGE